MAELLRDYNELAVSNDIRDRAANLPGGLTTLDAIHVATAETLGEELTVFITYDRRMANVARACGLPVASPGLA
jgi:predicted nucleic acid-binding protein